MAVAQPGFAVDRTELTAEVANLRAAPPPTAQKVPLTVEATNSGEVDSPETTNPPLVPATSTGNDPQGAIDPR